MNYTELYLRAVQADKNWQSELELVYGKLANIARYDSHRNERTPVLAILAYRRQRAMDLLLASHTREVLIPK